MGFKDLVVQIDSGTDCAARLDYALGLASVFDAHLAAVHAAARRVLPGYVAAEIPAAIREAIEESAREERRRLREAVEAASRRAGRALEFRAADGEPGEALVGHARLADLTVVGQGGDVAGLGDGGVGAAVALGSGRPVLNLPSVGRFDPAPRIALVAWNGSREAARAVADALPLLRRAARVVVLSVAEPEGLPRRVPGAGIAAHLARHGVRAEVSTSVASEGSVASDLLSRAADLGAGLLVIGCYGHSRLRESVLGGVTRQILSEMTLPVVMSH